MIEPHSAHDGASAWVWKLTFVAPRLIVMAPVDVPPPPLPTGELTAVAVGRMPIGVTVGRDHRQLFPGSGLGS